jgi:hypothetical protein
MLSNENYKMESGKEAYYGGVLAFKKYLIA